MPAPEPVATNPAGTTATATVDKDKAKPEPSTGYAQMQSDLEVADFSETDPMGLTSAGPPVALAPVTRRPLERVVVQHVEDARHAEQIR